MTGVLVFLLFLFCLGLAALYYGCRDSEDDDKPKDMTNAMKKHLKDEIFPYFQSMGLNKFEWAIPKQTQNTMNDDIFESIYQRHYSIQTVEYDHLVDVMKYSFTDKTDYYNRLIKIYNYMKGASEKLIFIAIQYDEQLAVDHLKIIGRDCDINEQEYYLYQNVSRFINKMTSEEKAYIISLNITKPDPVGDKRKELFTPEKEDVIMESVTKQYM